MDDICKYCIDILVWWEKNSAFSYGEINVWLFIILQPLLISIFIATTVFNCYSKNEKIKKIIAKISIVAFVVLVVFTLLLVGIPVCSGIQ